MLKCPKIQQCEMSDSTELFFGHVNVCVFLPSAKSNQLFLFLFLTKVTGINGNEHNEVLNPEQMKYDPPPPPGDTHLPYNTRRDGLAACIF